MVPATTSLDGGYYPRWKNGLLGDLGANKPHFRVIIWPHGINYGFRLVLAVVIKPVITPSISPVRSSKKDNL